MLALPSIFALRTPLPVTATGGPSSSSTPNAGVGHEFASFFRRAGAWLALMHCFVVADMHQENVIAVGDQPVPVDLETTLQAAEESHSDNVDAKAYEAAREIIADSVMAVGLLPAYGRSAGDTVLPSAVSLLTGRRKEDSPGPTSTPMA